MFRYFTDGPQGVVPLILRARSATSPVIQDSLRCHRANGEQKTTASRTISHVTISLIFRRLGFSLVPQFPATGATSRSSSADSRNAFE